MKYGSHHTEEVKAKISSSRKGKGYRHTEEAKAKIRQEVKVRIAEFI